LPWLLWLSFRLLEVADDVGEGQQAVTGQYVGVRVGHRHVGDGSADAVVLVQQIEDDDLQFGLVVFGKAIATFDVPQPEVLVKTL